MKAVILNEAGDVNNLKYEDIDSPKIKGDEVLIKTKAISINPVDVKSRASEDVLSWLFGEQRPIILGWDVSGEIVEVGINVKDYKVGDEVFGMINFSKPGNAYAEYVSAPSKHIALKPKIITHEEAASSSLAALTAYQALSLNIKKGDKVIIYGASGGVGHFAVQIAKYFGAYVIGVSSLKNKDFVLSIGADEHFDYTKEKIANRFKNIDFILDTVAGDNLINLINITKVDGKIISIPSQLPDNILSYADNKNVKLEFILVEASIGDIKHIVKLLENKIIKPHIYKYFNFNEIREAHKEVETGRVVGKVVVSLS